MHLLSNKDLNIINKMKGQIIDSSLKADRRFILERLKEEGLRKVEKAIADLGYSLKYENIEKYQWYPVQMDALFIVLSKKIFSWDKDSLWKWGCWAAKIYFLTKMMLKYFVSKEFLVKSANRNWRKYYTQGELVFSFEGKKDRVELKDFIIHPDHLDYFAGYLYQIAGLIMPPETLELKIVKTDSLDYHLFEITR
jgi:hypothetical protein